MHHYNIIGVLPLLPLHIICLYFFDPIIIITIITQIMTYISGIRYIVCLWEKNCIIILYVSILITLNSRI